MKKALHVLLLASYITLFGAAEPAPNEPRISEALRPSPDQLLPTSIIQEGYTLVQNWDFGTAIRTQGDLEAVFATRYIFDNGRLDHLPSNGEWERYRDNDNHRLTEQSLDLVAHVRGGLVDGGIESGMLRSKWAGKYGYFECRMKVPRGRGLWPAFWLSAEDAKWPPEIDVVEIVSNGVDDTRTSYHVLHPGRADKLTSVFSKLDRRQAYVPGFDYAVGYHVFGVEWTPGKVRHFVDGVMIAERDFHWLHDNGSDAGPAHVIVNLGVGGRWPGPPVSAADFPATLSIDYIRVWQKR